jgi:multidrug efflux pump subunit AcrB
MITSLIVVAGLLLGLMAVIITPREEEPQIVVPMVDIYLPMPGASPAEVQERVVKPFEAKLWELKGVEYLYSMSRPGMGIITVRFLVGQPMEESLVKLYNKVMSNRPLLPPGSGEPLVAPKSIDDVPILCLTLWSERYDHATLRRLALENNDELRKSENTAETTIIGGLGRQVRVTLDTGRLSDYGLSPLRVAAALQRGNNSLSSGSYSRSNQEVLVETGAFLENRESLARLVVGVYDTKPVYLSDVANISDGIKEPDDYLFMGLGPAAHIVGANGVRPLIDFAEMKRREGMQLDEAIIEAGAVRFRPMLLTGAAVVVGSFVIVFDPIFQGLAIAMMCGEIASTTLSRVTIPILYYLVQSWKERHAEAPSK